MTTEIEVGVPRAEDDTLARALSADGLIRQVLAATAVLDFPSIAANATSDLTINVAGASVNSPAITSAPAALNSGLSASAFVSAAGVVTVRLMNTTAGAIDPASATFRVVVFRF